ncbi:MAG: MFS transporter [Anaerolineae bacterium]|nr:MFS transporter [Anaerolineae bacterium]
MRTELRSLAYSFSQIVAPALAGLLLRHAGLTSVLLIDIVTFLVAASTLVVTRIPRPAVSEAGAAARGRFWDEASFGFRYVFQRRGLLYLLVIMMGIHLTAALTYFGVLPAMILARTAGDALALASVQSAMGLAGVLGGVLVSAWGGPKRRIHGVLLGAALSFILGDFLLGVGRSTLSWASAGFIAEFFIPFIVTSDRAIWQSKVPPDVQGRVFAIKGMLQTAMMPVGYLLAGPLADRVFEPAFAPGGALVGALGGLVGEGPGAGMGMMFVCTSIIGLTVSLSGYLFPAVRHIETDLPDHDAASEAATLQLEQA